MVLILLGRDLRTAGVRVQYTESHNDDVTTLSFHPTASHLLLSGSTDSLVNVYNLLTPPSGSAATPDDDVDNALHQVINHGSSIHRAGFLSSGGNGYGNVFALSHDEQLAVYKLFDEIPEDEETQEAERKEWGDVRGLLGCEYVVDVVPRKGGGGWIVAGNCREGWVDLVGVGNEGGEIGGWGIGGEGVRLVGGHGEEVVRGVYLDERVCAVPFRLLVSVLLFIFVFSTTNGIVVKAGMIYTAGEDGLVKVWREPGGEGRGGSGGKIETTGEASGSAGKKRTKEQRKERKEKKETKARYKPY